MSKSYDVESFHDRLYGMKFYLCLNPGEPYVKSVELSLGLTTSGGEETAYLHEKEERVLVLLPKKLQRFSPGITIGEDGEQKTIMYLDPDGLYVLYSQATGE